MEEHLPKSFCFTSFVRQPSVQASRQTSAFLFLITLEPACSGITTFVFPEEASIGKHFLLDLCISIGSTGVPRFAWSLSFLFYLLSFPFIIAFRAPRLIENDEWELDGRP